MELISVLFTGGIFIIGFLSLLLVGINTLLNAKLEPLKENQALLKENQSRFDKRLEKLESKIDLLLEDRKT